LLLPSFSLGPAPYPHPAQSEYELFGDAYNQHNHIQVTDLAQHQKGALWSKRPWQHSRNFQFDLTFRVGGHDGHMYGDGFALWLNSERGVGGNALGGPNHYKGVGVFFDTYKNDNFRGKRHPYVYAFVNDGTKDYETLSGPQIGNGCHIPFRLEKDVLEDIASATVARLTLVDNQLSVVMRPYGSVDWVQCFKFRIGASLPDRMYVGITAMTGDLIDRHQMLEIRGYTEIETDPYSYAHVNDITQMPDMWYAMRDSGDVAREFDDWEKSMMEDTEFDPIEEVDDYDYDPYDYEGGDYDEEEEEEEEEEEVSVDRSGGKHESAKDRKIRERRERFEKSHGRRGRDDDDDDDGDDDDDDNDDRVKRPLHKRYTRAELQTISEIIEGTELGKKFKNAQAEQREKMNKMRQHLEADISEVTNKLTGLVRDIRRKEHNINSRLAALSKRLEVDLVAPLELEHKEAGRRWVMPFMVFLAILIGVGAFGYRKYKTFMKTHLL